MRFERVGLGEIPVTLESGTVVQLPDDWPFFSDQERVNWISQSSLAPDVATQLEQELGLDVFGDASGPAAQGTQAPGSFDNKLASTNALKTAIANSPNGYILAPKNSSAYIVAQENPYTFSAKLDPTNPSMYRISSSDFIWYVGAGAVLLLVAVVAGARK